MKLTPLRTLPRDYQLPTNGAMQLPSMKVDSEDEEFFFVVLFYCNALLFNYIKFIITNRIEFSPSWPTTIKHV